MDKCFICEKHKGNNSAGRFHIFSTSLIDIYHMFPEDDSVYLGHVFLETKRHIAGLAEMTLDEAFEIGKFQKIVSEAFKEYFSAEHIYSFVFGDGVSHLHIHLIPRYEGAPEVYRGMKVDQWPDAPHGNDEEAIAYCRELEEKIRLVESKLI